MAQTFWKSAGRAPSLRVLQFALQLRKKHEKTSVSVDTEKPAATPPNQSRRWILTDYFNNYNFSKAQIIRFLMMVIEPKHVGAVLI